MSALGGHDLKAKFQPFIGVFTSSSTDFPGRACLPRRQQRAHDGSHIDLFAMFFKVKRYSWG